MFERLTDRAAKSMALANQEAQRRRCDFIGVEHMLLGIIKEGTGVGVNVLKNIGVDLEALRREVDSRIKLGKEEPGMSRLPQTPRAKKAIEYAIEESRSLNHNYVGTEHLLLGLLRENSGIAAQSLHAMGVTLDKARLALDELLYAKQRLDEEETSQTNQANRSGFVPTALDHLPTRLLVEPSPTHPTMARLTNEKGVVVTGVMSIQLAEKIARRYNARGEE